MPVITASSPAFTERPPGIVVDLFAHQQRVLHATLAFEADSRVGTVLSNVGFVSCAPGAGKSLVMLALATRTDWARGERQDLSYRRLCSGTMVRVPMARLDATLVVAPACIVPQWADYVATFTTLRPTVDFKVMAKKADAQQLVAAGVHGDETRLLICAPDAYQVLAGARQCLSSGLPACLCACLSPC